MNLSDIRAFVPCKDYELSISFYKDIGFQANPASDDLTLLQNGDCFLFLQRFYVSDLADNFMLQLCVDDILEAHKLCSKTEYKTKISNITQEPWGQVFYLWGPSGELLHITKLADQ